MIHLQTLLEKTQRRVIGLMSGTSCDGLDLVIVDISGQGQDTQIEVLVKDHQPYSSAQRQRILKTTGSAEVPLKEVSQLNFYLARIWADRINHVLKKTGISHESIDLIGSHGHTFYHIPRDENLLGRKIRSTLQLGDPAALALWSGITTIGDFRVSDMCAGGQGAPLVPYFDWILFSRYGKNIITLNIGGIANITYMPAATENQKIIAFDSGPGNIIIDQLMERLYELPCDKNARIGKRGRFSEKLFSFLQSSDNYPLQNPPKSTGREHYGSDFVVSIINKALRWRVPEPDVIHTVTYYTAFTAYKAVRNYIPTTIDEVIVGGGGSRNPLLMNMLQKLFNKVPVRNSSDYKVDPDFKEAICFAVLANELINGIPANIPSVTGAKRPVFLGKICPA